MGRRGIGLVIIGVMGSFPYPSAMAAFYRRDSMSSAVSPTPAERSDFVTLLAWVFIGLSGLATLMATFEYMMVNFVMSMGQMQDAMNDAKARGDFPPGAEFMLDHVRQLMAAFFLLSLVTLVASVGLLKRWNWARLLFICLMALGIAWNLAGLFLQRLMMSTVLSSMPMMQPNMPSDFRAQLESMMTGMQVMGAIFALGFSVLFGWIIKRLMSAEIRREFEAPR
jgi:hypothetical protein